MARHFDMEAIFPPPRWVLPTLAAATACRPHPGLARLCTDNGVMIAWAGLEAWREGGGLEGGVRAWREGGGCLVPHQDVLQVTQNTTSVV